MAIILEDARILEAREKEFNHTKGRAIRSGVE